MKYFLFPTLLFISCALFAQDNDRWTALDASTLDMAYYPSNVAFRNYLGEDERNKSPQMKLIYSRPMKKGRDIFGALVPYGSEWRLGANEATTLVCYNAVDIDGHTLPAGAYSLSAVVEKDSWTVNFSTESGIWGNANRNADLTVQSVKLPVEMVKDQREDLAMTFQQVDDQNVNLVIEWDGRRVSLPIGLNPVVFSNVDRRPMDMVHYPRKSAYTNYLEGAEKEITPKLQVTYSRPQKKDRNVFGDLVKVGDVWRLGANEATEIAVYENVTINGTEVSRGRYALFAKINDGSWDIIFSRDYPIWGAYNRDESKDVATINVPVSTEDEVVEALTILFEEKSDNLVHMVIGWDKTRVEIPFTFASSGE